MVAARSRDAAGVDPLPTVLRRCLAVTACPHHDPMPDPTSDDPGALPFTGTDLHRVVTRLGRPLGRWSAQRLGYVSMLSSTGGLWRVTGPGWGCVAKWVRAAPAQAGGGMQGDPFDEASFTFWRREPDVFARGVADLLPAGVRLPELLHGPGCHPRATCCKGNPQSGSCHGRNASGPNLRFRRGGAGPPRQRLWVLRRGELGRRC